MDHISGLHGYTRLLRTTSSWIRHMLDQHHRRFNDNVVDRLRGDNDSLSSRCSLGGVNLRGGKILIGESKK